MRAIFAILGVALLSACANSTIKGQRTATPSGLGLVIADADRIVIANRWHGTNLQEFSHTFTGSEVRKVVDDVSFMSHASGERTDSIFDKEVQFYRGPEKLAAIYLAVSTFSFQGNEYFGDTGVLQDLDRKVLKLQRPPEPK